MSIEIKKAGGGGAAADSFTTIQTPAGTSPVADSATDTLSLVSNDSSVTITGDSTTDTVNIQTAVQAVSKGAFGASMTTQTVSSQTNNALTPGIIRLTHAFPVVNGITAGANGQITYVYPTVGPATFTHNNSSATAANRIQTSTGNSIVIQVGFIGAVYYDTSVSRWILFELGRIISATAPLAISTAGVASIVQANAGQNGFLSANDWSTFNSKVGGGGLAATVPFWSASNSLSYRSGFSWNNTFQRLGIQVVSATTEAALDVKSDVPQNVADPVSFSAALVQFVPPVSPTIQVTQGTPDIQSTGVIATPGNLGAGGYNAADIVDYAISATDGSVWGVSTTQAYGITDIASSFDVSIALTQGTQNFTNSEYSIARQVNGTGFNDYQRVSGSFTDTNTGWTGGTDTLTPLADDFLATATPRAVVAHGTKTSPISTQIVDATGYDPGFTDNGSALAFKMDVVVQGVGGDLPARIAWPGTRNIETSVNFSSGPIGGTSVGAPTLTPASWGYLSNGSALNLNYSYYATQVLSGVTVYSSNSINPSVSDPNNGNYYAVLLNAILPTVGKLVCTTRADAKVIVSGTDFYDDGVTTFPDSTTVTPTVTYDPVQILSAHGDSTTNVPFTIYKALDAGGSAQIYNRWEDSTGTELGYIKADASNFVIGTDTLGRLTYAGDYQLIWGTAGVGIFGHLTIGNAKNVILNTSTGTKFGTATNQKLAFYNATPVVQQTGNPVTALTTLGLVASPTAITETQGGTAQTSYTQGDILYSSASNTLSKLAKNTSSTRYLSNTGSSNNPAWAQVDLSNGVTGTLPVANGGTAGAKFERRLNQQTNQATSATTAETDLHTYTIAAATLAVNGDTIEMKSSGQFAASAFTKRVRAYFGGTLVFDSGALGITVATDWVLEGQVMRLSSNNQKCNFNLTTSSGTLSAYAQYTATAITDSGTIIIKTTGTEGTTGGTDVHEEMFSVNYIPGA